MGADGVVCLPCVWTMLKYKIWLMWFVFSMRGLAMKTGF